MTREQIALVRHSIAALHFDPHSLAMRFYARLFALDVSLGLLFPPDLNELTKIAGMFGFIVREAGMPGRVFPHIARLHMHYGNGTHGKKYDAVQEALLWALEKELGSEWTVEVREAWNSLYTASIRMIIAAPRQVAMAA